MKASALKIEIVHHQFIYLFIYLTVIYKNRNEINNKHDLFLACETINKIL